MPDDGFLDVANLLSCDAEEVVSRTNQWSDCESDRSRSSVSRAYYAVFRALKERLIARRSEWQTTQGAFPSRRIHWKLRNALASVLGESHALTAAFKRLLRKRQQADYDQGAKWLSEDTDGPYDDATDAAAVVAALKDAELDDIASELKVLDAMDREPA